MYFDERPKDDRRDLYDREGELEELLRGIGAGRPLILILGLRRTGKTSLLYTALTEAKLPHIFIDCREFEERFAASYLDFLLALERSINNFLRVLGSVVKYLKAVRGVKLMAAGLGVEPAFKDRPGPGIIALLQRIDRWAGDNGKKVILAFDEAQELRKVKGLNIQAILAYAYDRLKNIVTILTGSQVELLHHFLQVENPKAPLYGRSTLTIKVGRLSNDQALDFLLRGFQQIGIEPSADILTYAVNKLDGIIGWLTAFGARASREGLRKETIDHVFEAGVKLVSSELQNFLMARTVTATRYRLMLRRLAEEPATWTQLKTFLEAKEARSISPSIFTNLLTNLVDAGFVEKVDYDYRIADPVLSHAVRSGLV